MSYSKNYTSENLCKPIHDINYSTSICCFEFGKCGKEEEKLQELEYLENKKNFLSEWKTLFTIFEGLSFGEKIEIWQKIADTSFKSLYFLKILNLPQRSLKIFQQFSIWKVTIRKHVWCFALIIFDGRQKIFKPRKWNFRSQRNYLPLSLKFRFSL